jgi:hypothetical protein
MPEPIMPEVYASNDVPPRVLCSRGAYRQKKRLAIKLGFLLLGVLIVGLGAVGLMSVLPWTWADAWQVLQARAAAVTLRKLLPLVCFSAVPLVALYNLYINRHARLCLTPTGLAYQSPLPASLQWLHPSWTLQWQDVTAAYLRRSRMTPTAASAKLVLETRSQRRTLMPLDWVDPTNDVAPLSPVALTRMLQHANDQRLQETFRSAPLVQHLAAGGLQVDLDAAILRAASAFALESSPAVRMVLLGAVILCLYAATDVVVNHETYATWLPLAYYIGPGLIAMGLGALGLRRAGVPVSESLGVALVLGVTVGLALYPGLLRLNAMTDSVGLRPYAYVLQADRSLRPVDPALPVLRFTVDYWERSVAGSKHTLYLRQGKLGFYQVDMEPVEERRR